MDLLYVHFYKLSLSKQIATGYEWRVEINLMFIYMHMSSENDIEPNS